MCIAHGTVGSQHIIVIMNPRVPLLYYWYTRIHKKRSVQRRFWVHPLLDHGPQREERFEKFYMNLREDEQEFYNYFHLSMASFDNLLSRLENSTLPRINTIMRMCISTKMKLAICLRYLATGCSMKELHFTFKVGTSTISGIITDVCSALWDVLHDDFLPSPTKTKWEEIAKGFDQKANFPHCIGAIGGKHIRSKKPELSGSSNVKNKDYYSIVLLAVVDSDYKFVYVDIGSYGTNCDSYNLKNTGLWEKLNDESLPIPDPTPLTESGKSIPFVLVGDEAFALHNNLLRPFGGTHLDERKKKFNCRLSQVRRYVEWAFGIMAAKWRILQRPVDTSITSTIEIVKACIVLHNFACERDGLRFDDSSEATSAMDNLENEPNPRAGAQANNIRSAFADYFMSPEGSVPTQ
ncbi:protein ALP1-like [Coccinella septempunctata]|uniref:protein ALP1-like n=1 Tax=Coccinella septempunctata TaxID=41139 RepID=UPI001D08613C|nr:protein ALP1-like [Coccinella septempunctata]